MSHLAVAGFVIGALALLLAIVALAGERLKRPKLEIQPARWAGHGQFPWEFLVVRVFNRPLPGWIGWLFTRRSAEGCEVSLTYIRERETDPTIDQIPGRWSAAPEPLSWQGGREVPDPTKVPDSYRLDVPTTGPGAEVAVARSRNGEAYAFSAQSYMHPSWRRPGWELPAGRWRLIVRVASSDATASEEFWLEVAADGALSWSPLVESSN